MKKEITRSDKMLKEIIDLYVYDNGRKSILFKKESESRYALLSGGMHIVMMRFSRTEFEQVERICGEMGVNIEIFKED